MVTEFQARNNQATSTELDGTFVEAQGEAGVDDRDVLSVGPHGG